LKLLITLLLFEKLSINMENCFRTGRSSAKAAQSHCGVKTFPCSITPTTGCCRRCLLSRSNLGQGRCQKQPSSYNGTEWQVAIKTFTLAL